MLSGGLGDRGVEGEGAACESGGGSSGERGRQFEDGGREGVAVRPESSRLRVRSAFRVSSNSEIGVGSRRGGPRRGSERAALHASAKPDA